MRRIFIKSTALLLTLLIISCLFVFSSCTTDDGKRFVSEDTVYYIDTKNSSIMGIQFDFFLDNTSCITLRQDGTATIYIKVKDNVSALLNFFLNNEAIQNFDVRTATDGMIKDYLPGFSLEDMATTLELLRKSVGISVLGIDLEDPEIISLFTHLSETGHIPSNLRIPTGIGLDYSANYYIKDIYSEYSGEYTAIYMGDHEPNGEPYTIMTMSNIDGTDKHQIYLRIEMVKMTLLAKEG